AQSRLTIPRSNRSALNLKQSVGGLPVIEMFGTSMFVPVNEAYWKNYPSSTNYYEGPWWWWSNFKFMVAKIQPKRAD
ncbi:MAG: extracellular solute-binding protein family 5, partial [Hyphomicrobiales bacterium]|nr:extracellular solute-binding protein family 5 [Hyphomicrobiales bacterium]